MRNSFLSLAMYIPNPLCPHFHAAGLIVLFYTGKDITSWEAEHCPEQSDVRRCWIYCEAKQACFRSFCSVVRRIIHCTTGPPRRLASEVLTCTRTFQSPRRGPSNMFSWSCAFMKFAKVGSHLSNLTSPVAHTLVNTK